MTFQLLISILVILALGLFGGKVARSLGQPSIVGQLLAGILAGPSILGAFDPSLWESVSMISQNHSWLTQIEKVAVGLFLLATGLELDLSLAWQQRRKSFLVCIASLVPAFCLGLLIAYFCRELTGASHSLTPLRIDFFVAAALAISALPVIAGILIELKLYRTPIAVVIISSAVVCDVFAWLVIGVCLGPTEEGLASVFQHTVVLFLYVLFLAIIVRPVVNFLFAQIKSLPTASFLSALGLMFVIQVLTHRIGVHAGFSAFSFGLLLSSCPQVQRQTRQQILKFAITYCAPFYFAFVGLDLNLTRDFDIQFILLLLLSASALKLIPCYWGARQAGFSFRDAATVAIGLNVRGAVEILVARSAYEAGLVDGRLLVALVFVALGTTIVAGPAIKRLLRQQLVEISKNEIKPLTALAPSNANT